MNVALFPIYMKDYSKYIYCLSEDWLHQFRILAIWDALWYLKISNKPITLLRAWILLEVVEELYVPCLHTRISRTY